MKTKFKGELSDSFTNYNYVGNTKVSVSIKKSYANKCTLSEIFRTEILTYDHSNGFTYLQLGGDFIKLFLFRYVAF